MKLLAKTNRRYFLVLAVALAVGSAAMFLGVRALFDDFADERLEHLETEIRAFAAAHDTLPHFFQNTGAKLFAQKVAAELPREFADTLIFNELEQEDEPFRRLRFGLKLHGKWWEVDVLQSAVETEDIAQTVILLFLALMLALFAALFLAQKRMSEQLWQPFYATLERLHGFKITQPEPLELPATDTDEFAELNQTLARLTEKSRSDFQTLKRFTENASHEIQTPLTVIRAKLDALLQNEHFSEAQIAQLDAAQNAARRLSRLQQALLFLVKIENDQFQNLDSVDLKYFVEVRLALLDDFIAAKKLETTVALEPAPVWANKFLAETLVSNLIGNAVKHNLPDGGWLEIKLSPHTFLIKNSGFAPTAPVAELFDRFRRGENGVDGLGLGLAIALEICEKYGWRLDLQFENGAWQTVVEF